MTVPATVLTIRSGHWSPSRSEKVGIMTATPVEQLAELKESNAYLMMRLQEEEENATDRHGFNPYKAVFSTGSQARAAAASKKLEKNWPYNY